MCSCSNLPQSSLTSFIKSANYLLDIAVTGHMPILQRKKLTSVWSLHWLSMLHFLHCIYFEPHKKKCERIFFSKKRYETINFVVHTKWSSKPSKQRIKINFTNVFMRKKRIFLTWFFFFIFLPLSLCAFHNFFLSLPFILRVLWILRYFTAPSHKYTLVCMHI